MRRIVWCVALLGLMVGGIGTHPLRGEGVAVRSEVEVLLVAIHPNPPEIVGMVKMQHRSFPWEKDVTIFSDQEGQKMDAEAFFRRYDRQMVVLVLDPSGGVSEAYPQ